MRLDERNLGLCIYLNLYSSSIEVLTTKWLSALRVLILRYSKIKVIDTIPLVSLEYLNASCTSITELSTVSLSKIRLLWLYNVKIRTLNA